MRGIGNACWAYILAVDSVSLRRCTISARYCSIIKNKPFFDEFVAFVKRHKYENVLAFVSESNEIKMNEVLNDYFSNEFRNCLYDGIARPYDQSKSKWFFITWLLRDAPQQRLQPIVSSLKEGSTTQKRIFVINKIMQFVAPLMPEKEQWEWHAIAEVMLQRVEAARTRYGVLQHSINQSEG